MSSAGGAQKIKQWPTDLADPDLSPTGGKNISNNKLGAIAHSLSL